MIDGIAGGSRGRIDAARAAASQRVATLAKAASPKAAQASEASAASRMAQDGPPIDSAKVAAIRTAIAEGRYPVDPQAIAQRMIDLDLSPLA